MRIQIKPLVSLANLLKMSENRQVNVNTKESVSELAEEENQLLKDAGLWEEDLTSEEKRGLLSLIKESENCAKQEEIKRKHRHDVTSDTKETSNQSNEEVSEIPKKAGNAVSEDCDPIITFESPSTISRRKALRSPSTSTSPSPSKRTPNGGEKDEDVDGTFGASPIQRAPLHPVFVNSSVTIKYVLPSPNPTQDIVVSETDEESDDGRGSSAVGHQQLNSTPVSKDEEKGAAKAQPSSIEIICPDSSQSTTSDASRKSDSLLGSTSGKCSLNVCAVRKAISNSTYKEGLGKKPTVSSVDSVEQPVGTTDATRCNGAEVDCSKTGNTTMGSKLIEDKDSKSRGCKRAILNIEGTECIPVRSKLVLLSEKPSHAYFKVPYETETKCVKRIYSLITEWQSALVEYQRKLVKPLKWGAPITVDRQIKSNLLKKGYLNLAKTSTRPPCVDMSSSSSSPSEDLVSDSDEDFTDVPTKKKRRNGKKLVKRSLLSHQVANVTSKKQGKTNCEEGKSMSAGNQEQKEREGSPSTSTNVQNSIEMEFPFEDEPETESQNHLQETLNTRPQNAETSVASKSATQRKSFTLYPLEEEEPESTVEQSSPEIFTTQPTSSTKSAAIKNRNGNNSTTVGMLLDELAECSVTSCSIPPKPLTRNSMKRKVSPNPFSTPPSKKTATTSNQGEDIIRPSSSRLKYYLSSNRRKGAETEKSPDKDSQEANVLQAAVETSLPDLKPSEKKEEKSKVSKPTHAIPQSEQSDPDASGLMPGVSTEEKPQSSQETPSEREPSVECPLCQAMFSFSEIQAHASECNGPPEPMATRNQAPRGRGKRPLYSRADEAEVYYVETLKHSTPHSKR